MLTSFRFIIQNTFIPVAFVYLFNFFPMSKTRSKKRIKDVSKFFNIFMVMWLRLRWQKIKKNSNKIHDKNI